MYTQRERWDGAWAGPEAAREVFGADEVYSTHELPRKLLEIAGAAPTIMFDYDRPGEWQAGCLDRVQVLALSLAACSHCACGQDCVHAFKFQCGMR